MSSFDPHVGGSLSEMAPEGTKVPQDAAAINPIPSVPRPDQREEHHQFDREGLGEPNQQMAADNARDMPRSTKDIGPSGGEVITGVGDTLPAEVESKRLNIGAADAGAKGSVRSLKHGNLNRSKFDRLAGEDFDATSADKEHSFRNE